MEDQPDFSGLVETSDEQKLKPVSCASNPLQITQVSDRFLEGDGEPITGFGADNIPVKVKYEMSTYGYPPNKGKIFLCIESGMIVNSNPVSGCVRIANPNEFFKVLSKKCGLELEGVSDVKFSIKIVPGLSVIAFMPHNTKEKVGVIKCKDIGIL